MNTNAETMNWVKLRHECSPFDMFTRLRHGAEQDINTLESLRKDKAPAAEFKIIAEHNFFTIKRYITGKYADRNPWVQFSWDDSGITVKEDSGKVTKAIVTLNDDGNCRLKLESGEELNCWQFRKHFLEDLFFNL